MSSNKRIGINHQISEEAAQWLVEFRTGDIDAAGRRDFDSWVRTSPEHLRAFIEMAALWSESGAIDAQYRLDVEAIIARAQGEQNVVGLTVNTARGEGAGAGSLAEQESPLSAPTRTGSRGNASSRHPLPVVPLALAASLLVVILGAALFLGSSLFGPPTYATGVGEQRSIRLPDGSRVVLDSRSRLRVAFTAGARQVELLQGQALFYVAKNPQSPFLVRAGETVIRDIGTQFDVNRRPDGTVVTVVEGRVAVTPRRAAAQRESVERLPDVSHRAATGTQAADSDRHRFDQPIFLSAGEQVDVPAGELAPTPIRVNVSSVMAWTHGQVVLESATLRQVAEAFNRYSTRKLVAEDHGAVSLRLSGVFATDPDFLIRYLRERPDIVVTETDSEVDIIRDPTK